MLCDFRYYQVSVWRESRVLCVVERGTSWLFSRGDAELSGKSVLMRMLSRMTAQSECVVRSTRLRASGD